MYNPPLSSDLFSITSTLTLMMVFQCYIPGSLKERAIEAFSDANCAAKFGEGFTGDCVAYPNTPGLANVPFGPAPYCQKGRDAVPDCPMTGFYSCSNPFVLPACCLSIQQICGAV